MTDLEAVEAERLLWWPTPSDENMSETKLPASDIVSLSKFIMGESFMDTHSRPLEAVGLQERLYGGSVNRVRRRSPYSRSTDFDLFITSTISKGCSRPYRKEAMTFDSLRLRWRPLLKSTDFFCFFCLRGGGWGWVSLHSEVDLCLFLRAEADLKEFSVEGCKNALM